MRCLVCVHSTDAEQHEMDIQWWMGNEGELCVCMCVCVCVCVCVLPVLTLCEQKVPEELGVSKQSVHRERWGVFRYLVLGVDADPTEGSMWRAGHCQIMSAALCTTLIVIALQCKGHKYHKSEQSHMQTHVRTYVCTYIHTYVRIHTYRHRYICHTYVHT